KMQIICPGEFVHQPQAAGGGSTRELARAGYGAPFWRLCIDGHAATGPLATFPGMTRILAVVGGAGMAFDTPIGWMTAMPMQPLRFSADLRLQGQLLAGPVRAVSLIFDPARWNARLEALRATRCLAPADGGVAMVVCLGGGMRIGGQEVPPGAVARIETGESVLLPATNAALVADLRPLDHGARR
ncbi:MAG: hypothetical protein CVT83_07370, partial [Alphaproteobacteria bacterium HGW-Alphaproteobacteria-5]